MSVENPRVPLLNHIICLYVSGSVLIPDAVNDTKGLPSVDAIAIPA